MANEATITAGLVIKKAALDYRSVTTKFQADVSHATGHGPGPGPITVTTAGTDISFSPIATPAWCEFRNFDASNFYEIGIWDGATFHELAEVLATEHCVLRLSRNMTGLRLKADTASVDAWVGAFEA